LLTLQRKDSRYRGGEPKLSGPELIEPFDSDPDISELCPATGDHRTLALAKTDLTAGDYSAGRGGMLRKTFAYQPG
jgi:hypothetical protein